MGRIVTVWSWLAAVWSVALAAAVVSYRTEFKIVALLAAFVTAPTCVLVGVVITRRMRTRAGIHNTDRLSYADVMALTRQGWTTIGAAARTSRVWAFVRASQIVTPRERIWVTEKFCSGCGREVPPGSHRGQRCPYCGAVWSYERTPKRRW